MVYYSSMKKFLKFLLLSPMSFACIGCDNTQQKSEPKEPQPIDVIVISGQSNAVGCTHTNCIPRSIGYSKYQEYMEGYPGIQIAYDCWTKDNGPVYYSQNQSKNDTFVKVMLGQGNSLATFGPEIGIAETLHEKYDGKLALIKFACGASALKDDWVHRDSKMYPKLIEYVKKQMQNLVELGYIPTIKALCWMQGEGDAWDGYYQVYYDNTVEFVTNLREDLREYCGNKEMAFIDAAILANSKVWQYHRKVNEAKKQFAEDGENNIFIDTNEAGMHTNEEPFDSPDLCHYDSESEVKLGELFAEAFEPFLEPVEE